MGKRQIFQLVGRMHLAPAPFYPDSGGFSLAGA